MDIDYYHNYEITDEIERVVMEVLHARVHYMGKYTEGLEAGIAKLGGVSHGVAANSGTSTLLLTLDAMGIGPGDEVIVPTNAYVANGECPVHLGARPVFADCTAGTLCLDPTSFETAITEKTKAVIVLHTHGHPADMDRILPIARRRGIKVIENCCHALGGRYKGKPVGSLGDAAFFALSRKFLSVCGTGGVMVTDNAELANRVRKMKHHGWPGSREYEMTAIGYNFRMNEIQAGIGYKQLDALPAWHAQRRKNATAYTEAIRKLGIPVTPPVEERDVTHVYLHYVVRVPRVRNELLKFLHGNGIEAKVHYSIPMHLQPPLVKIAGTQGPFPAAEQICGEILSLPSHPGVSEDNIRHVVETMGRFFNH